MKKYAIIIGQDNEELSRKVQEALFAVGFEWSGGKVVVDGHKMIYVNMFSGRITYGGETDAGSFEMFNDEIRDGLIMLWPSYVLENAHLLDGAKKPWEIPPKGYRLVTDEERKNNRPPEDLKYCLDSWGADCWYNNDGRVLWNCSIANYAVPLDFTFDKVTIECEGKKVEISRESAKALNLI